MIERNKFSKIVDLICLGSIGTICFLYSLFWSTFAEIHIVLPFLDFPIFIGEILLFECVVLLVLKWRINKVKFNYRYYLFFLYVAWVLVRALHGYLEWGPLALRNAALFYYPFFAVIGYNFYRNDLFNQKAVMVLFIIILIAKVVMGTNLVCYFLTPYFVLSIVLILRMKQRWVQYVAFGVLLFFFPYKDFLQGSRSFLVANFVILSFLFFSYVLGMLKFRRTIKILSLALFFLSSVLVFLKFAPSEKVKSLTTPQSIIKKIQEYDQMAQERKKGSVSTLLPVKIYNPNDSPLIQSDLEKQKESIHFLRNQIRIVSGEVKEKLEQVEVVKIIDETQEGASKDSPMRGGEPSVRNALDEIKKEVIKKSEDQALELVQIFEKFLKTGEDDLPKNEFFEKRKLYVEEIEKEKASIGKEISFLGEEDSERAAYFSKELDHIINIADVTLNRQREIVEASGLEFSMMDRPLDEQKNGRSKKEEINGTKRIWERGLRTEYVNIVFRVLIWRDMVQEMIREKAWFGFSFGKPQRSVSIENSAIAEGEWGRDGWIAPHNAFLHIIYRSGILGFFVILSIFSALFSLIRGFIRKKSLEGLLLSSILIYWLVLASFLVVLELPYQAIPFWSLFGMAFAYVNKKGEGVARV